MKRKWGYWAGAGICGLGFLLLAVALGEAVLTASQGFIRAKAPGAGAVEFRDQGLYLGVYQSLAAEPVPARDLERLQFTIGDAVTGYTLPLQKVPSAQVMFGGRRGMVLFQTEVPQPGRYTLASAYADGKGPEVEFMLIHESLAGRRADIIAGFALFLLLNAIGVVIVWKTYRNAKIT